MTESSHIQLREVTQESNVDYWGFYNVLDYLKKVFLYKTIPEWGEPIHIKYFVDDFLKEAKNTKFRPTDYRFVEIGKDDGSYDPVRISIYHGSDGKIQEISLG